MPRAAACFIAIFKRDKALLAVSFFVFQIGDKHSFTSNCVNSVIAISPSLGKTCNVRGANHLAALPSFFNSLFLASKALKTISCKEILSTACRNFSFFLLRIGSIPWCKRSRQAVALSLASFKDTTLQEPNPISRRFLLKSNRKTQRP